MFRLVAFLLLALVARAVSAQTVTPPDLSASASAALSYGSDHVGAWLLAVGCAVCWALGFQAGRSR